MKRPSWGWGGWHSSRPTANDTRARAVEEPERDGRHAPSVTGMGEELRERIGHAVSTVRRAVLRRRRLLAFVCAAGAVLAVLRVVAPPDPTTIEVLVAAHDLPAGQVVDADDVELRAVPPDVVPTGLVDRADALGRTVAAPMRRGEPLTDVRLVSESLLAGYPGLIAVPVRIPDGGAVGLLAVGDRVDVLAADPTGRSDAEVVAVGAPVIALPLDDPDAGAATLTGSLGGRLVVLGATRETALRLAGQATRGLLSVTLCD